MSNVKSLFGGPTGEPRIVDGAVAEAETLMDAVNSGEVVGFAVVRLHKDGLASWRYAGMIGGYSMIGGLEAVKAAMLRDIDG
jgi:hypothetical protein